MFGVHYKDPGMSLCHGKFTVKEWISHGKMLSIDETQQKLCACFLVTQ